tara:strand:- start:1223 stop:1930 length:708 start_codon:yes stop_codon:yes gene_type:complete
MESVGDSIKAENGNWSFDGEVANNFEEHIRKSVPFYDKGHELIIQLSDFFLKDSSLCYELGSSTGLLSYRLSEHLKNQNVNIVGIDSILNMTNFAKSKYKNDNLEFINENVFEFDYKNADMFISYYLIQFIRPKKRQELLNNIYKNLNWGGAFICFEKVRACDARFQDITTNLYNEFKIKQGFTSEEILSKSRSLKGVLEPFSTQGNKDMFVRAGFKDIISIFKYISFEGFLCIK